MGFPATNTAGECGWEGDWEVFSFSVVSFKTKQLNLQNKETTCVMAHMNRNNVEESSRKLDALNQDIWENGFTRRSLTGLAKIVKEIHYGTTLFERIPQAQQSGLSKGSSVLTSAGIICRGCPGTESEVREIYHTNDLIGEGGIQERLVEVWARITGCWFESPELFLSSQSVIKDYGTESEVYFDVDTLTVRKLISLKHYNVLRLALDRVIIIFSRAFLSSRPRPQATRRDLSTSLEMTDGGKRSLDSLRSLEMTGGTLGGPKMPFPVPAGCQTPPPGPRSTSLVPAGAHYLKTGPKSSIPVPNTCGKK